MLKRYAHVLFDLDGTIYDSEFANTDSLLAVVKSLKPDLNETYDSLLRFMGTTASECLKELGFNQGQLDELADKWSAELKARLDTVKPFDGMVSVLAFLKKNGVKLGIVTSRDRRYAQTLGDIASVCPVEIAPYFDVVIASNDVSRPKPFPDSILRYMEITGAKRDDILFVGDTKADADCARASGIAFGLALWGCRLRSSLKCDFYFANPWDIISAISSHASADFQFFRWASEINAIGQIGLCYAKDRFDLERYARLREIACEIMSAHLDVPKCKLQDAFIFDKGYPTPKIDTRAAVFNDNGEILMVKERISGLWNLPGGWCDEHESLYSNTVKEVREEALMEVSPLKLIAILDRNRHNTPPFPYGVLKAFILCAKGRGDFKPTDETCERRFFARDALPGNLRLSTNTREQIELCFRAKDAVNWIPVIE